MTPTNDNKGKWETVDACPKPYLVAFKWQNVPEQGDSPYMYFQLPAVTDLTKCIIDVTEIDASGKKGNSYRYSPTNPGTAIQVFPGGIIRYQGRQTVSVDVDCR